MANVTSRHPRIIATVELMLGHEFDVVYSHFTGEALDYIELQLAGLPDEVFGTILGDPCTRGVGWVLPVVRECIVELYQANL